METRRSTRRQQQKGIAKSPQRATSSGEGRDRSKPVPVKAGRSGPGRKPHQQQQKEAVGARADKREEGPQGGQSPPGRGKRPVGGRGKRKTSGSRSSHLPPQEGRKRLRSLDTLRYRVGSKGSQRSREEAMDAHGNDSGRDSARDRDADRREQPGTSSEGTARYDSFGSRLSDSSLQSLLKKLGAGLEDLIPVPTFSHGRLKGILAGLKAAHDEPRQIESLNSLCEVLSVSSEEMLAGFAVDAFVPILVDLLATEHSPDVALLAARALTNLADVLPASCASIVHHGAVPVLCGKLLAVEYIDLAEQSLQALDKLSRDHGRACLRAGGVSAVLSFLDFFQTGVQRVAARTAANMCRGMRADHVPHVSDAVPILMNLVGYGDSKIVESACLALGRVCAAMAKGGSERVDEVLSRKMLEEILKLMQVSEAGALSSPLTLQCYYEIVQLLRACAAASPKLADRMLASGLHITLQRVLGGSSLVAASPASPGNIMKSTENLTHVLRLVDALLPPFPDLTKLAAHGVRSLALGDDGEGEGAPVGGVDADAEGERAKLVAGAAKVLFPTLLGMTTGSTMVPQVKSHCLSAIKKLLLHTGAAELDEILRPLPVANGIVSMLSSDADPSATLSGIVIAEVLMEKLPGIYLRVFTREGVLYSINEVASRSVAGAASPAPSPPADDAEGEQAMGAEVGEDGHEPSQGPRGKRTQGAASSPPPNKFVTPHAKLEASVVRRARLFRSRYLEGDAAMGSAGSAGGGGGVTMEIEQLKGLSKRLSEGSADALGELLGKFAPGQDGSGGVSAFQLAHGELDKGLMDFLFLDNGVRSFAAACASQPQAAEVAASLVGKLQEVVSSGEKFAVATCPTPSARYLMLSGAASGMAGDGSAKEASGLAALAHPFKLRLCRAPMPPLSGQPAPDGQGRMEGTGDGPGSGLRDYSSNVVLAEPLSTFAAIEDFLWMRVSGRQPGSGLFSLASRSTARGQPRGNRRPAGEGAEGKGQAAPPQAAAAPGDEGSDKGKGKSRGQTSVISSILTRARKKEWAEQDQARPGTSAEEREKEKEEEKEEKEKEKEEKVAEMEEEDRGEEKDRSGRRGFKWASLDSDDEMSDYDSEGEEGDDDDMLGDEEQLEDEDLDDLGGGLLGRRDSGVHELQIEEAEGDKKLGSSVGERGQRAGGSSRSGGRSAPSPSYAEKAASAASQKSTPKLAFSVKSRAFRQDTTLLQAIMQSNPALLNNSEGNEGSQAASGTSPLARPHIWDRIHSVEYSLAPSSKAGATKKAGDVGNSRVVKGDELVRVAAARAVSLCGEVKEPEVGRVLAVLGLLAWLRDNHTRAGPSPACEFAFLPFIQPEEFVSAKLTSKVLRQLQDVLLVCGKCLPAWLHLLVRECPCAFPFDLRRQYLLATAVGGNAAQRMIQGLISGEAQANQELAQDVQLGRTKRQKVRIHRDRLFASARAVMQMYATSQSALEIEYFGEVGTGLGPTLEFYTLLSRELQARARGMWVTREAAPAPPATPPRSPAPMALSRESTPGADAFIFGEMEEVPGTAAAPEAPAKATSEDAATVERPGAVDPASLDLVDPPGDGLFPLPTARGALPSREILEAFTLLGRAAGKSLQDGRLLDVQLSSAFWRLALGQDLVAGDICSVDEPVGAVVRKLEAALAAAPEGGPVMIDGARVEDLGLVFTLPGDERFELHAGGAEEDVTSDNAADYVREVAEAYFGYGTCSQVEAFRVGFCEVFDLSALAIFRPSELETLVSGQGHEVWTRESLGECLRFDHGYSAASPHIHQLLHILAEFTAEERRQFLKFVTGAPRLPPGGLAALSPKLTIVRKNFSSSSSAGMSGAGLSGVLSPTPRGHSAQTPTSELTLVDTDLPSVMTCANYLKLPPYTSKAVMRERLVYAMREGAGSFDLS